MNTTDKIASKLLGKKISGSENYDSSLLVAVPRLENRNQYNINSKDLPFLGWDCWHAYEFSALTQKGIPITRVLKLKYNCNNDYIVESKSLKLYLNSFNMTKIGSNTEDTLTKCKNIIEKDLSEKLKTKVTVNFLDNNTKRVEIFKDFENLMKFIQEDKISIEKFKEAPEVLKYTQTSDATKHYLTFDSLRSNCRVTHQPDFGDVFIYYNSTKHIEESSLLEYLVSFRTEYHFHEECCEMIYKRLHDILDKNDELLVCALYTRRGGIDICPIRYSPNCKLKDIETLINTEIYARNGIKQ